MEDVPAALVPLEGKKFVPPGTNYEPFRGTLGSS